eukprot:CAMPEP_0203773256 /NCGR_PEP_ID=MMETSP0099_2-20121227/4550_1 /ASSEMBLY_ACC=CAM_ASM_000209 /TAXON_ID=96639 /ORGANISM=" , Strain NY0313808BC1" /LENGTH=371 /DNA_ID=CAMNT_0050671053 /DNA_START=405 /DNA_END=1520 /DNA_ORIENTATION=+
MASFPGVVIVGGGIVGVSTAYFLGLRGVACTVIEQVEIAAGASGKAGGFLAKDWGSASTSQLHVRGFQLHEELAKELDIKSFRYLPTNQVTHRNGRKTTSNAGSCNDEVLVDPETTRSSMMDESTAQVTPLELCTKMWEKARANGAKLELGKAVGLERDDSGMYTGVVLEGGKVIRAGKVVLAMGPWTVAAEDWLGNIRVPMFGIASSSMIVQPKEKVKVQATAVFCEDDKNRCHLEFYPRPDNTIYVCGFGSSPEHQKATLLKMPANQVKPNEARIPKVKESFHRTVHPAIRLEDDDSNVTFQCCLRPCTRDSLPMIGMIPDKNVIIATGHNCWGILWGPETGRVVSELVVSGSCKDVSLKPFDPLRFRH